MHTQIHSTRTRSITPPPTAGTIIATRGTSVAAVVDDGSGGGLVPDTKVYIENL